MTNSLPAARSQLPALFPYALCPVLYAPGNRQSRLLLKHDPSLFPNEVAFLHQLNLDAETY
jgi:hypothetical protein